MRLDPDTVEVLQPWFPGMAISEVRLVSNGPVCWFVRRVLGQGAMTIAPFIFFGRARFDSTNLASVALVAHELAHIEQYRRYGHTRFLLRYLRDLAGNRFRYSRELPLEVECYALQATVAAALRTRLDA